MDGQTATNPQTGEKVVLRNGQWVPMGGAQTAPQAAAPSPQAAPRPQPTQRAAPQFQGELPNDVNAVFPSLVAQESGGRAGVLGPMTRYGQAIGRTQMLPATAREMAQRVGVPFDESMLRGTTPEAAAYQDRLGLEYLKQGFEQTGNMRDALRYYHGGPDRRLWGPKTQAYSEEVLARVAGGDVAPVSMPQEQPTIPAARQTATNPQTGEKLELVDGQWRPSDPASSTGYELPAGVVDYTALAPEEIGQLKKGARVLLPPDAPGQPRQIVTLSQDLSAPTRAPIMGETQQEFGGVQTFTPGIADTVGGFASGAAEQIPGLDEAVTAADAALTGRSFSESRDEYRAMQEGLNSSNRGSRVAGGLAGFGATLAVPGAGAANFIGRGATGAAQVGRAALAAAPVSALYGAGAAEGGAEQRALGALVGGATGAGAGAVVRGAAPVVGDVARRIGSGLSESGAVIQRGLGRQPQEAVITPRATETAQQYVARLVSESGNELTPDTFNKGLTAAERIGPSGVSNMAALVRRSGRAGTLAGNQLGARAQEQSNRVVQDFADLTGMDPAGSADMIQNLATAGRAKATPLYEAAYAAPVEVTPTITSILGTPSGNKAMRNAYALARDEMRDPESLGFVVRASGADANGMPIIENIEVRNPTMQTLDYIKRGLDDALTPYRDKLTGRLDLDNQGRAVVGLVKQFRDELTSMNPAYREALAAGGDPIRLEEAFRQSDRLFQVGTPQRTFNTAIERMGEAERNALVAGFADKLFRDAQAGKLGTRQLNTINVPVTREKLATLIGPEGADDFMRRIMAEVEMGRTGGRMAPGTNSITSEAQEAMREQDRGVGLFNDLARNIESSRSVIGGTLATGAQALAAPVAGFARGVASPAAQPVRDEIARLLLLPPEDLAALLARASEGSATQGPGALGAALQRASAPGGSQAGAAFGQPGAQSSTPQARRAQ